MIDDALTERVIAACIEVHRNAGPGLLESTYEDCVCHELRLRGISFLRQLLVPLRYKGLELESGYRLDLLVEDRVIVEVKAVEAVLPVHLAQLSTYLRATNLEVGLLINFNVPLLKQGIRRLTNRAGNILRSPSDLEVSNLL